MASRQHKIYLNALGLTKKITLNHLKSACLICLERILDKAVIEDNSVKVYLHFETSVARVQAYLHKLEKYILITNVTSCDVRQFQELESIIGHSLTPDQEFLDNQKSRKRNLEMSNEEFCKSVKMSNEELSECFSNEF